MVSSKHKTSWNDVFKAIQMTPINFRSINFSYLFNNIILQEKDIIANTFISIGGNGLK